jgi:hypothetical protein
VLLALGLWLATDAAAQPLPGPLRVNPSNPRYFTDGTGRSVYLTGSHEWLNLVDGGRTDPPQHRNYGELMHFMRSYNHNFHRLWAWEQSKWICEQSYPFWFSPSAYKRTGPGLALDGKPKFNLDSLDQAYFTRLRQRVIQAADSGVYTAVMLFDGWSIERRNFGLANPWDGHPFNGANNTNSVNADINGNGEGEEFHSYLPQVWPYQVRYIKRVVDAVNDLDAVLYEVSNESPGFSVPWQQMVADTIRAYQSRKPKQHVVGITGDWAINNSELYASSADWISPGDNGSGTWRDDPPAATGDKVVIVDSDHLWGIGGDRVWIWKTFLRGHQPIWMDQYDGSYGWDPGFDSSNPTVVNTRKNMGWTLRFANRMNLTAMTPRGELSATGYCLANTSPGAGEYLVYAPVSGGFSLDLTSTPGTFRALWFNPASEDTIPAASVSGGAWQWFAPPFTGDAVLYLLRQGSSLPSAPLLIEPADSAAGLPRNVTFAWTPVGGATGYTLQVSRNGAFTDLLVNDSTLTGTIRLVTALPANSTLFWRVAARNSAGTGPWSPARRFSVASTSAGQDDSSLPRETALLQNYPNPFNPSTTIRFTLANTGPVSLSIYNPAGIRVRLLAESAYPAGVHSLIWDGLLDSGLPAGSGIYFCRMTAGGITRTVKLVLVR